VCEVAAFDFDAGQCEQTPKPDNTNCASTCVVSGACNGGTCRGQFKDCSDTNPCTDDSCSKDAGCQHTPHVCAQPQNPCQVPSCDADAGCVTTAANDGTLCGDDDCVSNNLPVCVNGQCVFRRRPPGGGVCPFGWMLASMTPGTYALAYDSARGRVVAFGGGDTGGDATWLFNGQAWVQRFPAHRPPPRAGHAMTFDSKRQRVVLFGGLDTATSSPPMNDTWEWDGADWVQVNTLTAPPGRTSFAMAFDSNRGKVVLFGGDGGFSVGPLGDTWEYDGVSWSQVSTATTPSARFGHSMVFDSSRGRAVLFGGATENQATQQQVVHDDTWEYDGLSWIAGTSPVSPPPRAEYALAFDSFRRRTVMFGGSTTGGVLGDTWEYDGNLWVATAAASAAPVRSNAAMVYDSSHQRAVLLGGLDVTHYGLGDTWQWDGAAWANVTPDPPLPARSHAATAYVSSLPGVFVFGGSGYQELSDSWSWNGVWTELADAGAPSPRSQHAIAYDSARDRVVLFGGQDSSANIIGDTWEWDGINWSGQLSTPSPGPREGQVLVYDAARGQSVLFGGFDDHFNLRGETWAYDGGWAQLSPATSPSARYGASVAYDSARQRVVLYGGRDDRAATTGRNDTWEWNGTNWSDQSPAMSPPAVEEFESQLAFDSIRARTVLFVGPSADTWEWDGSIWTHVATPVSPQPRLGFGMAFDPVRQRVVLHAGFAPFPATTLLSDTWVYRGP
jgi:hypothetical protein